MHRQYCLWGVLSEEMSHSHGLKTGVCPSSMKDGKVLRCKFETEVPIVAVSKEFLIPDVPKKASGDRLHFPVVQALGDRSNEITDWL